MPQSTPAPNEKGAAITMREFLETVGPGAIAEISDLKRKHYSGRFLINTPDIRLHCDSTACGGVRTFSSDDEISTSESHNGNEFLTYLCQNCKINYKLFSVRMLTARSERKAVKFGEIPSFGPPTPARALTLIGGDRELFLKGRRCELQGLGIGAFTYYRRVIEDQRNRIFDEIIRVLETTDPSNEVIEELKAAKNEKQFTKSIEAIKHAMPSSLLVNGQNPLRLLHSALSEGVHSLTDDECLAIATAARTVLFEFSDRLAQALRDDAELSKAVALLNKPKEKTN